MSVDAPMTPPPVAAWQACAAVADDRQRLACFDALVARPAPVPKPPGAGTPSGALTAASRDAPASNAPADKLRAFWELDEASNRGNFRFISYRPNYFLPVQLSSSMNRLPSSPNPANVVANPLPDYRNAETKVQLSIRTKIASGVLVPDGNLWFTYTQQSYWQLYSTSLSAPFRSTDHEPELMYMVPLLAELPWGWRSRLGALSLVHQSNGQALPLSRSWNRLVATAGFEREDLAVVARLNQRLREDPTTDDNPDLVSWRGRLELTALWSPGLATSSLQWRTNLNRRGSLQWDWTLPVDREQPGGLRWYAQAFTGYGESLLDYNVRKTSLGVGVTLFGW
jgi:phospholipase A1/A2